LAWLDFARAMAYLAAISELVNSFTAARILLYIVKV